eukprot:6309798-Amphidinium_carterae.1
MHLVLLWAPTWTTIAISSIESSTQGSPMSIHHKPAILTNLMHPFGRNWPYLFATLVTKSSNGAGGNWQWSW